MNKKSVALHRKNDVDTSIAAANKVDATLLESIVYDVISKFPLGCTQDDVVDALSYHSHSSITPRFRPLINKGFVVDTGERRKGRSGVNQRVLAVTGSIPILEENADLSEFLI